MAERANHWDIRIGTIVPGGPKAPGYIQQIVHHGFESFQISFQPFERGLDFEKLGSEVRAAIGSHDARISSVFLGANPMGTEEKDVLALRSIEDLIDNVHRLGTDMVCAFTGRVRGASIPDSLPRFREIWEPLAKRAADKGVRLAFENCSMGGNWLSGDWNIAHSPTAWEMMFDAVPAENVGLEWEPCHQMILLMEPIAQLREWAPKFFHIHGKDASIHWDIIRRWGLEGGKPWAFHRTPGFGDSDWTAIISELRRFGYAGTIDIEGWHDPVYVGELEMTGQVKALRYLKECRGGVFYPNVKED